MRPPHLGHARERAAVRGGVGTDHDVGIEDAQERLEVAGLGRGDEGIDDLPLAGERHVRGRRAGAPDATSCTTRELAGRGRRPIDDRRDLIERQAERVVEDERQPLGGREPVEDDEHRKTDRIREQRQVLGVAHGGRRAALDARDDRVRDLDTDEVLSAGGACPQPVEAQTRDDRRQPAAEVLDRGTVGSTRPEPGVLDRVLGLGQRAEHAIRHRPQMRAMVLESSGQPVRVGHPVTFSSQGPSTE